MTQSDFIKAIAPYCIKYAKKYGFKVASPSIAQACLESAYGTSTKAKHHNYFGLKYRANRLTVNNGTFIDGGSEQTTNGTYVPITDQWFNFDNMEKGVEGYFQFINIGNYSKVKAATTPLQYLQEIKNAGYATSLNYVNNVNNVITKWNLTEYDKEMNNEIITKVEDTTIQGGNSSLVDCVVKSPNHSGKRTHVIDRISPHCVVGQLTAESIGGCFTSSSRKASCNYGIGKDGRVVLVVDEINRSWCTSSNANDQRAVTIECASDSVEPYAFNNAVYNKLIDLCVDICKRNGKRKLLWFADKDTALNYNPKADEMVLTVHRWFANKSCPGNWMYARMQDLADKVNIKLGNAGSSSIVPSVQPSAPSSYLVKVTADSLNIRKGPGTNYGINGTITNKGTYTIVETQGNWGKLKSGAGWISLKYTQRV